MSSRGLLTFGAIPAISVDTPHYPEETDRGRGRIRARSHKKLHMHLFGV